MIPISVCLCRESFPNDLQFTILMRFTVDQTQTPNLKVNEQLVLFVSVLFISVMDSCVCVCVCVKV